MIETGADDYERSVDWCEGHVVIKNFPLHKGESGITKYMYTGQEKHGNLHQNKAKKGTIN